MVRVGPEKRAGPERTGKAEPPEPRRVEPVAREAGSERTLRHELRVPPGEGARRERRRAGVHRRAAQRTLCAPIVGARAAPRSIDRAVCIWRGACSAGAADPAAPAKMRPTATDAGATRDYDPRVPARRSKMPGPAVMTAEMPAPAGMTAEMFAAAGVCRRNARALPRHGRGPHRDHPHGHRRGRRLLGLPARNSIAKPQEWRQKRCGTEPRRTLHARALQETRRAGAGFPGTRTCRGAGRRIPFAITRLGDCRRAAACKAAFRRFSRRGFAHAAGPAAFPRLLRNHTGRSANDPAARVAAARPVDGHAAPDRDGRDRGSDRVSS